MAPNSPEGPEAWYGITDPVERKRIQDRLAQRARRRRLALAGKKRKPQATKSSNVSRHSKVSTSPGSRLERSPFDSMAITAVPRIEHGDDIAVEMKPTVYTALFQNGIVLGLLCSSCIPSRSKEAGADVPFPLQPTALQLTTLHAPWIDRFPFPRMRDNVISLGAVIEDEEFLSDLFSMQSFTVQPEKASWDPTGWSIGKRFAQKWGYLFY